MDVQKYSLNEWIDLTNGNYDAHWYYMAVDHKNHLFLKNVDVKHIDINKTSYIFEWTSDICDAMSVIFADFNGKYKKHLYSGFIEEWFSKKYEIFSVIKSYKMIYFHSPKDLPPWIRAIKGGKYICCEGREETVYLAFFK